MTGMTRLTCTILCAAVAVAAAACSAGDTEERPDTQVAAASEADALPLERILQGDRQLADHGRSPAELAGLGAELWEDASLSGTGTTACGTCHQDGGTAMMGASFAEPYPHRVTMAADRAGLERVTAAEMVQLCMSVAMRAQPLDYGSIELAGLTARVLELQEDFDPDRAPEAVR